MEIPSDKIKELKEKYNINEWCEYCMDKFVGCICYNLGRCCVAYLEEIEQILKKEQSESNNGAKE